MSRLGPFYQSDMPQKLFKIEVLIFFFDNLIYTWSDLGWTLIQNVIRHKLSANKKMVRILTYNGLVDVTDDHSLLRPDGTEVTPNEVNVGSQLMHYKLNVRQNTMDWINSVPFFKEYYDKKGKLQSELDSGWYYIEK